MSEQICVTGASGHLGRRVIEHLLETHGVEPGKIIATTRDPGRLRDLAERGVAVRAADFDDPSSLPTAFAGAGRLLIVSTDAIDRPGRRLDQHRNAVAAAKASGVQHLFYTSMPQPEDSLITFAPDHLGTERAIEASGLEWTILRDSWYMENLLASLPGVVASGRWFTAAGAGKVAYIAREDCARAAAAALMKGLGGTRYTLTGPDLLSVDEIAALVSEVTERPIEVVQVSDEALIEGMVAAGIPAEAAPIWASFDANTRVGKVNIRTDDVERLTGRAPESLREFLVANRNALLG